MENVSKEMFEYINKQLDKIEKELGNIHTKSKSKNKSEGNEWNLNIIKFVIASKNFSEKF